jgi:hypothetical protein
MIHQIANIAIPFYQSDDTTKLFSVVLRSIRYAVAAFVLVTYSLAFKRINRNTKLIIIGCAIALILFDLTLTYVTGRMYMRERHYVGVFPYLIIGLLGFIDQVNWENRFQAMATAIALLTIGAFTISGSIQRFGSFSKPGAFDEVARYISKEIPSDEPVFVFPPEDYETLRYHVPDNREIIPIPTRIDFDKVLPYSSEDYWSEVFENAMTVINIRMRSLHADHNRIWTISNADREVTTIDGEFHYVFRPIERTYGQAMEMKQFDETNVRLYVRGRIQSKNLID